MRASEAIDFYLREQGSELDEPNLFKFLREITPKERAKAEGYLKKMQNAEERGKHWQRKVWSAQRRWDRQREKLEKLGILTDYEFGDILAGL